MKFLKIFLITLFVLIILLVAGIFIVIKTYDVDQYKGRVADQLSELLNRKVTLAHLGLQFLWDQGLQLYVEDVEIANEATVATTPCLTVAKVYVDIDVWTLLRQRQLVMEHILFDTPKLYVVRSVDGHLNLPLMEEKSSKRNKEIQVQSTQKVATLKALSKETKAMTSKVNLELSIGRITLRQGEIYIKDHSVTPSRSIEVTSLNIEVQDFSLKDAFTFDGRFALWHDTPNVYLQGSAQLASSQTPMMLMPSNVNINLEGIPLVAVMSTIGIAAEALKDGVFEGAVTLALDQLALNDKGLEDIKLVATFNGVGLNTQGFIVPLQHIDAGFTLTGDEARITDFVWPVASGMIQAQAHGRDLWTAPAFTSKGLLKKIQIRELIPSDTLSFVVEGTLEGSFEASGKGATSEDLMMSLTGQTDMHLTEGRLVDVNILDVVLSRLQMIPQLKQKLNEHLSDKYKKMLTQADTPLARVDVKVGVANQLITLTEAILEAEGFFFLANGQMNNQQEVILESSILLEKDLSTDMVKSVGALGGLLDAKRRVGIPMRTYRGPLAQMRIYPDVEDIGKNLLRDYGKQELKKVLFKALDIDIPEVSGSADASSETTSPSEASPEAVIIEGILDALPFFN